MDLLLILFANDILMILLYIVYHKRNIKSTVKEELPLYSPGKKVITDEFIYSEEVEKLKKQKKAYNKKRVLEKK